MRCVVDGAQLFTNTYRNLAVISHQLQQRIAKDEVSLPRFGHFSRNPIGTIRYDRIQTQNITGVRDPRDDRLALSGRSPKFRRARAKYKDSSWWLPLVEELGSRRIAGSACDFVKALKRTEREITERPLSSRTLEAVTANVLRSHVLAFQTNPARARERWVFIALRRERRPLRAAVQTSKASLRRERPGIASQLSSEGREHVPVPYRRQSSGSGESRFR